MRSLRTDHLGSLTRLHLRLLGSQCAVGARPTSLPHPFQGQYPEGQDNQEVGDLLQSGLSSCAALSSGMPVSGLVWSGLPSDLNG